MYIYNYNYIDFILSFGSDAMSFAHLEFGIFSYSSLQFPTGSVRLDGDSWLTVIFRSHQRSLIGLSG